MREPEKRVTVSKLELRTGADGYPEISGIAAAYNVVSADLGGFVEIIAPGAFAGVLRDKPDVRCLVNHDPNMVLGRTKSGTLKLWESDKGLMFKCSLPDTQCARDVRESIMRGDMDQCSFAFRCSEGDDSMTSYTASDGKRTSLRTIHNFSALFDVSAVTFPAYPDGTAVNARSRAAYDLRRGVVPAVRKVKRSLAHQIAIDSAVQHFEHILNKEEGSPAELRRRARRKMEEALAEEARIRGEK